MNRKLELFEEKKKNWMTSKAMSELTEQVGKETASDVNLKRPTNIIQGGHNTSSHNIKSNETDIFLNRLTDKLTDHIRDELRKEMQMNMRHEDVRDKVAQKMESYLEAELSTHTCKICFELMTSPHHTPILLFPCGHTFCQQCIDTHVGGSSHSTSRPAKKSCPYCRTPIESRAVNQSLKELIDQFSRQQALVKDRSIQHLDQVFPDRNTPPKSSSSNRPSSQHTQRHECSDTESYEHNKRGASSKYAAQLKSCEMRYVILKNELEEVGLEEQLVVKRKNKIIAASDHLTQERVKIDKKMSLLQEERDLIDQHLTEQKRKQDELQQTEFSLKDRSQLVRSTLLNVQMEMDKLKLLVQGIRGIYI